MAMRFAQKREEEDEAAALQWKHTYLEQQAVEAGDTRRGYSHRPEVHEDSRAAACAGGPRDEQLVTVATEALDETGSTVLRSCVVLWVHIGWVCFVARASHPESFGGPLNELRALLSDRT